MAWKLFSTAMGLLAGSAVFQGAAQGRVTGFGFLVAALGSLVVGVTVGSYVGGLPSERARSHERPLVPSGSEVS